MTGHISDALREAIAEIFYEVMPYDMDGLPFIGKPTWEPGRNSPRQNEARAYADRVLALSAPVPSSDGTGEREKFELQNLLDVIEAVRGGRTVLRVSGNRGDSKDVGVIGIDRFVEICNVVLRSPLSGGVAGEIRQDLTESAGAAEPEC